MIITDHLPKWLINKAEAKQIIYLYGSVNIKFRVDSLKRIRGLGHEVMDGCTGLQWKYGPFNKFAESFFSSFSLHLSWHSSLSLYFMKVSFFPKVCLVSANLPWDKHLETSLFYRDMTSNAATVRRMNRNIWIPHLYQVYNVWHLNPTCLCKTCESYRTLKWWDKPVRSQCKPCQDISLWHFLHKSHRES